MAGHQPEAEACQTRFDSEELATSTCAMIGAAVAVMGGAASLYLLPGPGFRLGVFLPPLSVFIEGIVIYSLRARNPLCARLVLLFGLAASYTLALASSASPVVPFLAVLLVIANAAVSPYLGIIAAVLATLSLRLLLFPGDLFYPLVCLVWATAAMEWISSRPLLTALGWAWSSHVRANHLLKEVRYRQGELNRVMAALTEANRRLQRTSDQLAIARRRAEEARILKEQFAANISHELRTPLNVILGFTELMYLRPAVYGDVRWPPTLVRDIHHVYQSSKQLLELVNDVLDLSRTDAAKMPVHKEEADLESVIDDALSIVRNLTDGKDVILATDLPATLPVLCFDPTRIRQVLINLLNNAIRFTEHGSVTVCGRVTDREVILSVTDTGIGISPGELPRIFDEFRQVDEPLNGTQKGTGLGLAISKRLVELHGGRIWAESEGGIGSTFSFSLPISADVPPMQLLYTREGPLPSSLDEPTVVVIDQDPAVGTLLMRHLGSYRVVQVPTVEKAQDAALRWQPCAVITNELPGTQPRRTLHEGANGTFPRELLWISCSIPSHSWLAQEAGVTYCLAKPLTREAFVSAFGAFSNAREILVIDDDRAFQQLIARYLSSMPGTRSTVFAYDGAEALDRIRAKRPDVIILDLVMPGMGGPELLSILHSDQELCRIPVLVVTATDHSDDMLRQREGIITVAHGKGLGASDMVRYLRAILDAGGTDQLRYNGQAPPRAHYE